MCVCACGVIEKRQRNLYNFFIYLTSDSQKIFENRLYNMKIYSKAFPKHSNILPSFYGSL